MYILTGVSIAFAIAEQLLASSAYTLYVTHYPQLTSLSTMYTNVKNVHLRTSIDVSTNGGIQPEINQGIQSIYINIYISI
jgi:DNA mismatch repair ATPase MutS